MSIEITEEYTCDLCKNKGNSTDSTAHMWVKMTVYEDCKPKDKAICPTCAVRIVGFVELNKSKKKEQKHGTV